ACGEHGSTPTTFALDVKSGMKGILPLQKSTGSVSRRRDATVGNRAGDRGFVEGQAAVTTDDSYLLKKQVFPRFLKPPKREVPRAASRESPLHPERPRINVHQPEATDSMRGRSSFCKQPV